MLALKRYSLVLALVATAACDCKIPTAPSDDPSAPGVLSLAVTGTTQIEISQQTPLTATATFKDGSTRNVTMESTWASDASTVCSITPQGLVMGLAAGGCGTWAIFSNVVGTHGLSVISASAPTPDPPNPQAPPSPPQNPPGPPPPPDPGNPTVLSLTMQGQSPLAIGQSAQWQAIANMSSGATVNVTSQATWASVNAGIASVTAAGIVTGQSASTTTIQALYGGAAGSRPVTVTGGGGPPPPTVVSLSIAGNTTFPVGTTSQLQATAHFSDGSTQIVTGPAQWTSSAPAIASVAGGLVGGQSAGTSTITAAWSGRSAQVQVQVTAAPVGKQLIGIEVTLDGSILASTNLSRMRRPQSNPSTNLNLLSLLSDPILELHVFALYSDNSKEDVTSSATLSSDHALLRVDTPGVLNATGVLVQTLIDPDHVVNVQYGGFLVLVSIHISAPVLGDLPITALQLPNVTTLSAGTQLPAVTAILDNGVGGTADLTIPSGSPGLQWEVTPKDYVPILGPILGNTVNAVLNPLGNLVGDLLTISNGNVQSVSVGPIGGIVGLLGGVLQVNVKTVVDGVSSNLVPSTIPVP